MGVALRLDSDAVHADEDIIPRDIRFGIAENPVRHWFGGDVAMTTLIDGLSIFLPEGEKFFIKSLKHYASKLKDRELAAEINGYAVQEAFHTREHVDYNRGLILLGYDVGTMERRVERALDRIRSPINRLAVTCAMEHLTATFSTMTLRDPSFFDGAAPAYRKLWMWHALEELEHKAVALDVLDAVTADVPRWQRYLLRVMAMNAFLIPFLFLVVRNVPVYLKADGIKPGPVFWSKLFWVTFVRPGLWRRIVPQLLRYYSPNFDPRNSDDAELVRKGRAWLARELAAEASAVPA